MKMRTYTRKRPEYQVIEGVEELCRLCLGKADGAVPIFAEDSDNVCATLPMRIMICIGLEVARDEGLPNIICKECYKELERYYTFRKKCEVTYQKLKFHMLALKEQEYSKAMAVKIESQNVVEKETVVESQHLLLTISADQSTQLVNLENLDNAQLENLQMQDITTTNPALATLEIQTTTSDLSLIMSTMLIELGVLRNDENGLVLVDESLRTVELEGDDDTKVILRLVEEDEDSQEIIEEAEVQTPINMPPLPSLLKRPDLEEILPIPLKLINVNCKEGAEKTKEADRRCAQCGKTFVSRSVLARHRRVHSGERPHACRLCDRRFAQRAVMLRHELVHRERRPFQCGACPKSFTQRAGLDAHARTHQPAAAMQLHRCALCDKVFLYASGLSRHMAVHTGRVHACGACARLFRDKSSLRRHRAHAHHARHAPHAPHTPAAPAPLAAAPDTPHTPAAAPTTPDTPAAAASPAPRPGQDTPTSG